MKAIILSASTGGGHMRAANAVQKYLERNGIDVRVVDAIEYISPILNRTITEGYEYIATKTPNIYKAMYKSSNNKAVTQIIAAVNSIISKRLVPLIQDYEPDILITTHPFSTEMASRLKEIGKINTPIMCIMTDYAPHRTWINSSVDAYVVSNDGMVEQMVNMGAPSSRIYPFGIPIEDVFYEKRDKGIILKQMGLDPRLPTILIMAGSFGVTNILKIYREILEIDLKFQIIVITGKNRRLYQAIEEVVYGKKVRKNKVLSSLSKYVSHLSSWRYIVKRRKNLPPSQTEVSKRHKKDTRILYFTGEVDKYMQAADLIITKPGGLTITEALACNLPMAVFDAIPGQEEENADFLVANNMAIKLGKSKEGINEIKQLLKSSYRLKAMRFSCRTFDKSDSLNNILKLLNQLCKLQPIE